MSYPGDRAALFRDSAALFTRRGGEKRIPKNRSSYTRLLAHRGQLTIHHSGNKLQKKFTTKLRLGSWNVRTLLDSNERHERRTAIIGRELARYNIDIAALSETRLSGQTELVERGAGYTFYCIGQQDGQPRQAGVGFAIRSSLVSQLEIPPHGLSPRLMTMQLKLKHGHSAVLISAYAPTLTASDVDKEDFYESLNTAIRSVPHKQRLFVLGDFNARVGRDFTLWQGVLGHHSIGNENSNGTMLLQTCAQHQLAITNTFFQMATKYKTTWQHPRSKHWHTLDHIIVRQRDMSEVHITRAMRGTTSWSDHRLLRSVVQISLCPQNRRRATRRKKLDVSKLHSTEFQQRLQIALSERLNPAANQCVSSSAEEEWKRLRDVTYKTASDLLGNVASRHQDWFDDQDHTARQLLDSMHTTHLAWINDKSNPAKKSEYNRTKQIAQVRLREMKNRWWVSKAEELQAAADRHDMKGFYHSLRTVHGPRESGSAPVKSADGSTLITDKAQILQRWVEHFHGVLNQQSNFDSQVLDEIPQCPVADHLDAVPSREEVVLAIKQLATGKAPGIDGIPAEVLKCGGDCMILHLTELYGMIWAEQSVPQDFRDAIIVHIYKRKGDRACCDNHRGISLLSIAGKALARILLNRLSDHVLSNNIIPESQCGFRAGRGTTDMIFTIRQVQEKCREQHRDLYMIFIDLTKAFDSVNRQGLWSVLRRIGCPDKFVKIIQSFHDGMKGQVIDNGEMSDAFTVINGTKQGCVLAPMLFTIYFSMMLLVAFKDCDVGIPIRYRTDGGAFNLRRLQSKTKTKLAILRDLLYADDCALLAHSLTEAQLLFDRFQSAASRFGLTVSLKKTEVMALPPSLPPPVIQAGGAALQSTVKFCYLGSFVTADVSIDAEVTSRLAKASASFGRLSSRLWNDHGIRLDTKIAVYKAAVLTTLLYGSETWTVYRRHVIKLDQFHMRCLRQIAHVKWQDMTPNTEVLKICNITGIEALLAGTRLRWAGHVARMEDDRLPKQAFFSELQVGERSCGGQLKRYKDVLKATLKSTDIGYTDFEHLAADRSSWRSLCRNAVQNFERNRVDALQQKRAKRKAGPSQLNNAGPSQLNYAFRCNICGRVCGSRIGLHSHLRTHS